MNREKASEARVMSKEPLRGSSDAPGLLAGVELQFVRALSWLVEAPAGAQVGLETGDDVVVESVGKRLISEQDKNSIQASGHPFADRSVNLWKTLSNWANMQANGEFTESTRLLLVTNRPVPNCLARDLAGAQQEEDLDRCVAQIRGHCQDPPESLKDYMANLEGLDTTGLKELLRKIELCDSTVVDLPNYAADLCSKLHFPKSSGEPEALIDALAGWLRRVCREKWALQRCAWISRSSFDRQYHAVLVRFRKLRTRERTARLVPVNAIEAKRARSRTFARQLFSVDALDPDIDHAIECYLRFSTERIRLTEIGDITEADWEDFFGNLEERWGRIFRKCQRESEAESEIEVGKRILGQTVDEGFRAQLAGAATSTEYFTSGGYHRLADDVVVWWHPSFSDLDNWEDDEEEL